MTSTQSIRADIETILPDLARFLSEQWRTKHDDEWLSMQTWISGMSAALYFVSSEAFEDIVQELDFLEQICTYHHRNPMCDNDAGDTLTDEERQKIVDYERGRLDRKYQMGYCGNTPEYEAGYFEAGPEDTSMRDAEVERREIVMRGWT